MSLPQRLTLIILCCVALATGVLLFVSSTEAEPVHELQTSRMLEDRSIDTELVAVTIGEIARVSDRIVWVKCLSVDTRRVEKYGGAIFTFTKFEVIEKIAGEIKSPFELRLLGGEIGDVIIDSPHMPYFDPGEEVILFLGSDNKDGYPVISPEEGIVGIEIDPTTGEKIINAPITDVALYHASTGKRYLNNISRVPVEDFIYSVRKFVNEQEK